jgi:hypothetical protein
VYLGTCRKLCGVGGGLVVVLVVESEFSVQTLALGLKFWAWTMPNNFIDETLCTFKLSIVVVLELSC